MFSKTKRYFFVPTDGRPIKTSYTYEEIKKESRERLVMATKPFVFLIVVILTCLWAFVSVLNGDVAAFQMTTIVVMALCGALGIYLATKRDVSLLWVLIVNAVAVLLYVIGIKLVIPLLFQHSNAFRGAMASIVGHESYNGSVGIVGHTPWFLMLFSVGIVGFVLYVLMVLALIASLSGLLHVNDKAYIGEKPVKPKHKNFTPKRLEDETNEEFHERHADEKKRYKKAEDAAISSYRKEVIMWRYRRMVATGIAPIWLSLIAVACSAPYISESYFNTIF